MLLPFLDVIVLLNLVGIFPICVFVTVLQMALVVQNLMTSTGDVRDIGLIPVLQACLGEGNGNPL